jgi:hypothetical protein
MRHKVELYDSINTCTTLCHCSIVICACVEISQPIKYVQTKGRRRKIKFRASAGKRECKNPWNSNFLVQHHVPSVSVKHESGKNLVFLVLFSHFAIPNTNRFLFPFTKGILRRLLDDFSLVFCRLLVSDPFFATLPRPILTRHTFFESRQKLLQFSITSNFQTN